MRKLSVLLSTVVAVGLCGCAQAGMFAAASFTEVELSSGNYEIVATNARGEAEAAYILGVSIATGPVRQTLAVWRIRGSGQLYGEAMEDLWRRYEEEYGPVEGQKLALVNVRFDADTRNLLVYTDVKVSIRADVVKFSDSVGHLQQ